jgi:hypothetical protein
VYTFPQIGKITGEEWKNMTEGQRAPYEEVARKQKEEYHKQMEVYKQKKAEVCELYRMCFYHLFFWAMKDK